MTQFLYAAESDGNRVIRYGTGLTKITDAGTSDVLLAVNTWDWTPMGPAGDNVFRMVIVTIRYTNGYHVRITPSVDGTALTPQEFSTPAGSGTTDLQAWVVQRGARLSVQMELLDRTGDIELVNIQAAWMPMRVVP